MKELIIFSIFALIGIIGVFLFYDPLYSALFLIIITAVAFFGENIVSGMGYYTYRRVWPFYQNIPFFIVPFWIAFITLSNIGSAFVVMSLGLDPRTNGILTTAFLTGGACFILDLLFIEPYLCRKKGYWMWKMKKSILTKINHRNNLTAPIGNYIVWFLFPFLSSCIFLLSQI